jgi:S1-C subfamily serine protease
VTWLDVVIVGFGLLMAVWGYSLGGLAGGLLVCGFVGGAFLGSRLGSLAVERASGSRFDLFSALLVAVLLAAVLGVVGTSLRSRLGKGSARWLGVIDGLGGAALLACLSLGLVWLIGAVSQGARSQGLGGQGSRIVAALDDVLPSSRRVLAALAISPAAPPAFVDPVPQIKEAALPSRQVPPPDPRVLRDRDVRAAGQSAVRVEGAACGRGMQGTGWVAKKGIVVTNAHVVAGQKHTTIELRNGTRHPAEAIRYEPRDDLAVFRSRGVASAEVRSLKLRLGAPSGTAAAILGYPNGGPYRVVAGRIGATRTVLSPDSYGRGPFRRPVTALRGRVRHGDSGGPVVDGRGRVVATTFLSTVPGRHRRPTRLRNVSGFGVPATVARKALARSKGRVGTGPCAK